MTGKTHNTPLNERLNRAMDHIAAGEQAAALDLFREIASSPAPTDKGEREAASQAHNQLGIYCLRKGDAHGALTHFDVALALSEGTPVLDMNRGLALLSLDRPGEAEDALLKALKKNASLGQAWFHLGEARQGQEKWQAAIEAFETYQKHAPDAGEPLVEIGLCHEGLGDKGTAAAFFEQARAANPELYRHYYAAAETLYDNHLFPAATRNMVRAGKILPRDPIANHMTGIMFQKLEKKDEAEAFFKTSLEISASPESYSQLAALYEKSNQLNDAWATASLGLRLFPGDPYLTLTLARVESRAKRFDTALERLAEAAPKTTDPVLKPQMLFQLGWLYDRRDEVDQAYDCYAKAKAASAENAAGGDADKDVSLNYIRQMKALDYAKLPRTAWKRKPGQPRDLAFLVGFPRSGTTLLNQILDSHPKLVGLEEKPTIPGPVTILQNLEEGYPKALEGLDAETVEKMRDAYFERIESYADYAEDSIVVDKLPLNLIHLPLIRTMFPDAKIILALRHPLGCSLSCFMHNFRMNNAMANMFSLDDITRFYGEVMDLWKFFTETEKFPFHTIRYEDVVADIQTEAKKICEFLGVEWSEEMLKYAKHARAKGLISTPSYHQVVQPLYSESLERWRRYEKYLAPFADRVQPYCKTFGYSI